MPKKILYWGPYSGHVGTIKAQLNSAFALHKFGGHDVGMIRAHSEFKGMEDILREKGLRLLDLGLCRIFPGLEKSSVLARRPYMLAAAFLGFIPLVRLLRRERPDVIMLNLLVAPAIIAAAVANIPVTLIVSVQGYPHFLGIDDLKTPLWKRLENKIRKRLWNLVYPRARYILTMTEQTGIKLARDTNLCAKQIKTVHNPVVDDGVLQGGDRSVNHAWYDAKVPVIAGMGRLTYQKGFDMLIRAVYEVCQSGVKVKLVIVGEGEDRSRLEALITELDINEYVDLVGHKKNPFPYIAHADLFVLSSRWEDPGHAIIEAAALGTPIVTTDCPSGPSELVEHGAAGWVCRTGDPCDMAEKIKLALAMPDAGKQKLAKQNANRFTLLSHFQEMDKLLKDIPCSV
ncbi:MAG TPA: glycosyltransferase [Gammaproteobacteria bacterium]|nr:glycosyltransferase [Gammaproteobacteria bacterium]